MKRGLRQATLVLALLGLAALLVVAGGLVPTRASAGHWAVTRWALQFAMQRSIATQSLGVEVPPLEDPALILTGAGHYDFGCRSCHGAPGEPPPRIARAMLPPPPDLAPRIRASNPRKLFHVVKHGLKFTGMPAWPAQERDDEVWAVVAFLLAYPELDGAAYRRLVDRSSLPDPALQALTPTASAPTPAAVQEQCARCHGHDGLGREGGAFPRLAGQRRAYLERALLAYADGRRPSGIMEPLAAGLDPALIGELAGYYSRLPAASAPPPAAPARPEVGADMLELGRRIAHEGIVGQRLPACVECHGPAGRRSKPEYPLLAGQPASYLEQQLSLFRTGARGGSAYSHLMEHVAPRLKPEQARAVAHYFATLPPDAPAPGVDDAREGDLP